MHDGHMKKLLVSLVLCTLLAACGGVAAESQTAETDASNTTLTEDDGSTDFDAPTTTVPLLSKPSLPKMVKCPTQDILMDTGEVFREIVRCVDGWAVGIPQRFVDEFDGDTDVEAEWVLSFTKSKWVVVAVCHMYHPIFEGSLCNDPYGDDPVNWSLVPPMPVQCVLWDGAKFKDSIAESGCPNPL